MDNLRLPPSLWRATAVPSSEPIKLSGPVVGDVIIIGAGYTGLSAALRAIERGLKPIVLEAANVGFGCSGRNGGVVSTKFRVSLTTIAKQHGLETAKRVSHIGHEAMDCVEQYVENYSIESAGFARSGNLMCAHNEAALDRLAADAKIARELFGDAGLTILDKDETAAETGSSSFVGGMLIAHAGVIHPMNYARGLARTVREKGGTIFENSAVVSVKYEAGGVEASTGSGIARAKKLIIATNGYSHLTRATAPIRKAIIPFRSAMIATDRIPQDIFATVVPNGRSCSETRRMMRWFRRIDDRLLYGGRGAFGKADSDGAFKALEKALRATFPQLEAISITHRWSGLVAMTLDSLPQMGLLDKNTAYSIGYNGTGIAMATLFGRHVMDLVLGEEVDLPLMRRDRPLDIPFYAFREPAVRVVAGWYQFLDRIGR